MKKVKDIVKRLVLLCYYIPEYHRTYSKHVTGRYFVFRESPDGFLKFALYQLDTSEKMQELVRVGEAKSSFYAEMRAELATRENR